MQIGRLLQSRRFRLLFLAASIGAVTILLYTTRISQRVAQDVAQHLYYVPILCAAIWFGRRGVIVAPMVTLLYALHLFLEGAAPEARDAFTIDVVMFHALGAVVGVLSDLERQGRERHRKVSEEHDAALRRLQDSFDLLRREDRLSTTGELGAGLAHEIRNPLASIRGAMAILARAVPPDAREREFVEIMEREVSRLERLVTEFLRFARPPQPRLREASLGDCARAATTQIEPAAQENGVLLECVSKEDPPPFPLDAEQVRQVLLNLILNAVQATPAGGRVRVSVAREENRAVVEVSDSGPGIPPENIQRIFTPFFTTRPQGTGLGLSISHRIVENHGGSLEARNRTEGGAVLRMVLPTANRP